MAEIKNIKRLFVVYGRDHRRWKTWRKGALTVYIPMTFGREHVVEDTDWEWDENHRDGDGYLLHLGGWCFGVGVFSRPLPEEMLRWIEDEAVWLNDVEPGDIGRWAGTRAPVATRLGYEYAVRRQETADEGRTTDPGHEHDSAQDHGREPVRPSLRGLR